MSEPGFRRVLEGQKALVIGVANDESGTGRSVQLDAAHSLRSLPVSFQIQLHH